MLIHVSFVASRAVFLFTRNGSFSTPSSVSKLHDQFNRFALLLLLAWFYFRLMRRKTLKILISQEMIWKIRYVGFRNVKRETTFDLKNSVVSKNRVFKTSGSHYVLKTDLNLFSLSFYILPSLYSHLRLDKDKIWL